jgi:hypothetical protein
MSYALFSGDKYLGPLAAGTGLTDLAVAVDGAAAPLLADLLDSGAVDDAGQAAAEARKLIAAGGLAGPILATLTNLAALLEAAENGTAEIGES